MATRGARPYAGSKAPDAGSTATDKQYLMTVVEVPEVDSGTVFDYEQVLQGRKVERIRAWIKDKRIGGVEITLTNQPPKVFGDDPTSDIQSLDFLIDEIIISLILVPTANNNHLGGIHFKTNKHRDFDIGLTGTETRVTKLGEGLFVGVQGKTSTSKDDKDALLDLGFQFLRPVKSAVTIKVHYPNLEKDPTEDVETLELGGFSTTSDPWQFQGQGNVTNTWTWSEDDALSHVYAAPLKITLPVPYVVTGSPAQWAFRPEENVGEGDLVSIVEPFKVQWSQSGKVDGLDLSANINRGETDVESGQWDGLVLVTFYGNDVPTITYPIQGNFSGVQHSDVDVVTASD